MKKIMWAIYGTKHSKSPRFIFEDKRKAESYKWIPKQVIRRVELDFKPGELSITARLHQYSMIHSL